MRGRVLGGQRPRPDQLAPVAVYRGESIARTATGGAVPSGAVHPAASCLCLAVGELGPDGSFCHTARGWSVRKCGSNAGSVRMHRGTFDDARQSRRSKGSKGRALSPV